MAQRLAVVQLLRGIGQMARGMILCLQAGSATPLRGYAAPAFWVTYLVPSNFSSLIETSIWGLTATRTVSAAAGCGGLG